jgi:hypothetical protein
MKSNHSPDQSNDRRIVSTDEAALLLNRKPQTLRKWACLENGPIRPVRIYGRLGWPLEKINQLTSGLPA